MSQHVRDLVLRRYEQHLSIEDADHVRQHLTECPSCATYEHELERNENLLRRSDRELTLPPLRLGSHPPTRTTWSAASVVLATVALIVGGLLVGGALQRARESTAVTPTPQGVAASPVGSGARELAFFQRNLGVLVFTDAAGSEQRRVEFGDGLYQTPTIDSGSGSLAIWRFPRSGAYVPAELLVWDGTAVRVVARVTELMPLEPLWSADGLSLYFVVTSPPSEAGPGQPPRLARLLATDVDASTVRTVRVFDATYPLVPLVARDGFVAGFAGPLEGDVGRYLVVDANDGHDLASAPRDRPFTATSFAVDAGSRLVAGLSRRFEGTDPAALRLWNADDYSSGRTLLELGASDRVWFWPGRSEVLVSGTRVGRTYEILSVATNGTIRSLLASDAPLFVKGVAPDGGSLVIGRGVAQDLVRYHVSGAGLVEDGPIAAPLQRAEFIGWVVYGR